MDWLYTVCQEGVLWLRESHPLWLIGAIAFLPLVGVPISPLWVLSGLRFGPVWGAVIAIGSTLVNISSAYWLAARYLRRPVEKILAWRNFKVPTLAPEDETSFVLLCRITPGFPLVMQNYVLGCARVRFSRYLLVSVPIMVIFCTLVVLFGDALAESNAWRIVLTFCLVVAAVVVIRLVRKWMRRRGLQGAEDGCGPG